jgi:hypothetical protein
MASSSKKKTTFAKLTRENKVRERRQEKEARKAARKREAAMVRSEPSNALGHERALGAAAPLDEHGGGVVVEGAGAALDDRLA